VIKSGRAWRRWRAPEAFPRVETNVVVIASGGNESGATAAAQHEFESEHATIEIKRSLKVCDLQVHMTNTHMLADWFVTLHRPKRGDEFLPTPLSLRQFDLSDGFCKIGTSMRKTFHLRFAPFGTLFKRSEATLRHDGGVIRGKIDWFHPDIRPSAPGGWAILLAAYASCVDGGKRLHADRCRRLHAVLYAAILRRRSPHEDGIELLFSEARRAIISKQLNPIFDALFDDDSAFAPELELLRNERHVYDRDLARARKSIVSL
jgi:hypothetical protein